MRAIATGLLLASLGMMWAADKGPSLNVKPGQWETTMTTTTSGETPIAAELLEKLTPEQRARMEERMKANSGEKTRTLTYKRCMTKEDIDKGLEFGQDQGKCTRTVVSSTGSAVDVQIACSGVGMTSRGAMHFEALSPESMKGSGQMTMTGGGHTASVRMSLTSKWIGPKCSSDND